MKMTSMFWGLRLESGKKYSTTVDKSFHVSMAALDCTSVKSDNEVLSVMLEEDESNVPYILCNLQKSKAMQSRLDLNFMSGDRVTFFCKGTGVVHLSGYIVPDEDELSEPVGEDEDDEDWEECEEEEDEKELSKEGLLGKLKKKVNGIPGTEKRKLEIKSSKDQKKAKLETVKNEDSDEDEDDEEEDSGDDEMGDLEGTLDDSDEMGEEEEDDDESNEESETENSNMSPITPKSKKENKKLQAKEKATPNKVSPGQGQRTPNGLNNNESSKKEKKEKGASPSNPTKLNVSEGAQSPKKNLEGGVSIKDIKVGNGPVCKSGRMASVYYVGRLKNNNKVFDSTQEGTGFKFRVGRGEVIKGWDIGLMGMKVGGKRRIIVPPHMAYGQKGLPPKIPSNAALIFEVELKALN